MSESSNDCAGSDTANLVQSALELDTLIHSEKIMIEWHQRMCQRLKLKPEKNIRGKTRHLQSNLAKISWNTFHRRIQK